ncbi:hypothetical protein ACFSFW_15570 [Fredinandcohnia salidurans]|uniref:Uncharacterized protein n=1 Tax=Fredinandcohnia salidurans TaxID=2595041 RepID=A0ABW4MSY6_9BACI
MSNDEKSDLLNLVNGRLETKNRLLKLILMNPDKNMDVLERRKKQSRYEEQIYLLEDIKGRVISCTSTEDIQRINTMIDYYKSID